MADKITNTADLLDALADLAPVAIGDCASPRDMMIAIHEGHAAALDI